jgi:predicted  nucleic acid-binding Zn-ribbon protein
LAWFSPFWVTPSEKAKEAELEFLREEVKNLEEALKEARRRMEEIEKEVSQGKAQ